MLSIPKPVLLQFGKIPILSLKFSLKIPEERQKSYSRTLATILAMQFLFLNCLWAVSVLRAACRPCSSIFRAGVCAWLRPRSPGAHYSHEYRTTTAHHLQILH